MEIGLDLDNQDVVFKLLQTKSEETGEVKDKKRSGRK